MEHFNKESRLAENIILLRKSRDLNQSQLGDKLGYTDKAISKWELKESLPDIFTISKIANFFDVTIDDLLYSENIIRKSNKKKNKLLVTILSMSVSILLAGIIFLVLSILNINRAYIVWIAALSISGIVGVVFSSLWYGRLHVILSCYLIIFPISIIVMILLSFNFWWAVLIVALSLAILLTIGFRIKIKKK